MNDVLRALTGLAFAAALITPAGAVTLAADGSWQSFDVDAYAAPSYGLDWIDAADGSALSFTFSIANGEVGTLTVVDAGFAGDTFLLYNNGSALASTSAVAVYNFSDPDSTDTVGTDFDAALADARYSRAVLTLGAGTYSITGSLLQSTLFDGEALDATVGGISLSTAAVPEPATTGLLLSGLLMLGFMSRRTR